MGGRFLARATSTGLAQAAPARALTGYLTAGSDAATVVIKDSEDGSTSIRWTITIKAAANTTQSFDLSGLNVENGLYVTLSGT